jgi:hypothetical protein
MERERIEFHPVIDSPDRLSEYYRDEFWLAAYPLNATSLLDYFAFSPFYDKTCINERMKLHAMEASHGRRTGVEYVVKQTVSPELFIIERLDRRSSTESVVLSVYYCLQGTIYQAPDLATLLSARVERAAHLLSKAILGVERLRDAVLMEESRLCRDGVMATEGDARIDDILNNLSKSVASEKSSTFA